LLRAFGQSECGHRRRVGGKEVFCSELAAGAGLLADDGPATTGGARRPGRRRAPAERGTPGPYVDVHRDGVRRPDPAQHHCSGCSARWCRRRCWFGASTRSSGPSGAGQGAFRPRTFAPGRATGSVR